VEPRCRRALIVAAGQHAWHPPAVKAGRTQACRPILDEFRRKILSVRL
jgi:hypothetical protein